VNAQSFNEKAETTLVRAMGIVKLSLANSGYLYTFVHIKINYVNSLITQNAAEFTIHGGAFQKESISLVQNLGPVETLSALLLLQPSCQSKMMVPQSWRLNATCLLSLEPQIQIYLYP